MRALIERASGSLAVKALPAIYGVGLILLVIRVIPLGDFGRYAMALAYVNLVAALSRGLWGFPLVIGSARGERGPMLAPAFWLSGGSAIAGGLLGLVILPLLGAGMNLALLAAVMLVILVPRDLATALTQSTGRVWAAFLIESGYFLGSLAGFSILAAYGALRTAEAALLVNVVASALSALLGVILEPCILRPGMVGDWKGIFRLGRWIGLITLCDIFFQQGDALLVGMFFSAEAIAPYLAARTLLRMYSLLSQAVNFLVLPSASRHRASQQMARLRKRLKTVMVVLTGGLVPVNVAVWLLSPVVFPLVLGAKYIPAVPFFRVLIFASFLEPVYSILSNALAGVGRPQWMVAVLSSALIIYVAANLVLLPIVGIWAAPAVLLATYGALAVGSTMVAKRHLVD